MGLIEKLPDGFVVTDLSGLILEANAAFLDLAQAASTEQVRGKSLGDWLGRMGIDFPSLTASLREHGTVRNFPTIVRGGFGITETVEVSAVLVEDGELPCYGFVLRSGPAPPCRTAMRPRPFRARSISSSSWWGACR